MASLTCSDASSWSSSSDITEPVSPASPPSSTSSSASPPDAPTTSKPSSNVVATCDSTTKKRRRRYSDCSWDLASGNRRTRRLSAQSGVTATSAAPSDGSLIGFPSKWYNCLWGSTNNELFSDGDIGVQVLDIGHHGRHTHHHQSWPLIKRSGQLKITQFFSTQVSFFYPLIALVHRRGDERIDGTL